MFESVRRLFAPKELRAQLRRHPGELAELRKRAGEGVAAAQYELGDKYRLGWYEVWGLLRQDHAKARHWLLRAFDHGYTPAVQILDKHLNECMEGFRANIAGAVVWLRNAAEQGDVSAQAWLGDMYMHGTAVPQNHAEALRWLRKAAERGHPMAQGKFGTMYANGYGVVQNDAQALIWWRKAAKQGYTEAGVNICCYKHGRYSNDSKHEG